MSYRLEVAIKPEFDDPAGLAVARRAREHLSLDLRRVRTRSVYKIDADVSAGELKRAQEALTDPVIEESAVGRLPLPDCDWIIRVGFKPGVTDNVGRTARVFLSDLLGRAMDNQSRPPSVYTETLYLVWSDQLRQPHVQHLARELLANSLIERIDAWNAQQYEQLPEDITLPLAGSTRRPVTEGVPLPDNDGGLIELSRERTLALSLDEMYAIRAHYRDPRVQRHRAGHGLPTVPTDVELEAIAQTWSEHCKHKIFNARINYTDEHGETRVIDSLFKSCIVEATRQVGERVDWLVSVFHDNAGVVRASHDLYLVFKVETHNSPSALDPYGGSITGIVGVNRDPFGTGRGAALLTNTWGYCLGSPLYSEDLPQGLLHPRRVRDGVHQGVIDGGNQSGIPYSRGFERFDDRFVGKPLVFCGTVGLMPPHVAGAPSEQKEVHPGDIVVMVGGRIGTDGIHGATFSSEALHQQSPAQAVQIGDPITQKRMTDMLLEARDQGLYRTLTDNGAGGLSSSVGEMAQLSGGAELNLERAPLKYEGLLPWEILLSEAQERMTLAVAPDRLPALLDLAQRREVEATPIGRFTDDGRFRLHYDGRLVGDLDLAFLHQGCPTMELDAHWQPPSTPDPGDLGVQLPVDFGPVLLDIVGSLDLCDKSTKARQYDHEVKGLSVIKPLVGLHGDVPSDATVMRIRHGNDHVLLLSEAIAPRLSDIDPAAMTDYVVDLAFRRIIAAGGRVGQIAALDNFCWPDPVQSDATPDGKQKLAGLVRSCEALLKATTTLDLPLISGKDSMKNDSVRGGVKISIPPTLLVSTVGWMEQARRAVDLTPAGPGEQVYVLGTTMKELGGSELYAYLGRTTGRSGLVGRCAPRADLGQCRTTCGLLETVIHQGLVSAAHALHQGGLAVGLAMVALAGDLGLSVDLGIVPGTEELNTASRLFSETPSRFLATVRRENAESFEAACQGAAIAWARIGETTATRSLQVRDNAQLVFDLQLDTLRRRYTETMRDV